MFLVWTRVRIPASPQKNPLNRAGFLILASMKIYPFNKLSSSDLIIDAIYEGGNKGNVGDDPINKIVPVGNQGGFRYAGSIENLKYIILFDSVKVP